MILALPALLCIFLSKNIAYRHLDQTKQFSAVIFCFFSKQTMPQNYIVNKSEEILVYMPALLVHLCTDDSIFQ